MKTIILVSAILIVAVSMIACGTGTKAAQTGLMGELAGNWAGTATFPSSETDSFSFDANGSLATVGLSNASCQMSLGNQTVVILSPTTFNVKTPEGRPMLSNVTFNANTISGTVDYNACVGPDTGTFTATKQ